VHPAWPSRIEAFALRYVFVLRRLMRAAVSDVNVYFLQGSASASGAGDPESFRRSRTFQETENFGEDAEVRAGLNVGTRGRPHTGGQAGALPGHRLNYNAVSLK
jgi:hypothetical protein